MHRVIEYGIYYFDQSGLLFILYTSPSSLSYVLPFLQDVWWRGSWFKRE